MTKKAEDVYRTLTIADRLCQYLIEHSVREAAVLRVLRKLTLARRRQGP